MTFNKLQQISQIEDGEVIHDIFVVKKIGKIQSYANNEKFRFELTLADKSGEIKASYWGGTSKEDIDYLHKQLTNSMPCVVHVKARSQEYNNQLALNINKRDFTIVPEEQIPKDAFIEVTNKNIEDLKVQLQETINQVQDQEYKNLLVEFFNNSEFQNNFTKSPATMFHHHNTIAGLLEHTLNTTHIATHAAQIYKDQIDFDLLITACLLHGIGKLEQLKTTVAIEFTAKGALLGDTYLATQLIQEKAKKIQISEDKLLKLLNAILAQKGKSALKKPATPEGLVLQKAKDLDASLCQILNTRNKLKQEFPNESVAWGKEQGNVYLR